MPDEIETDDYAPKEHSFHDTVSITEPQPDCTVSIVTMGYALTSESARFEARDAPLPPQLYRQQMLTACLVPLYLAARYCSPLPLC